MKGKGLLEDGRNRVEGEILGAETGEEGSPVVALLLRSGERVRIPMDRIQKAHLIYRWD